MTFSLFSNTSTKVCYVVTDSLAMILYMNIAKYKSASPILTLMNVIKARVDHMSSVTPTAIALVNYE